MKYLLERPNVVFMKLEDKMLFKTKEKEDVQKKVKIND